MSIFTVLRHSGALFVLIFFEHGAAFAAAADSQYAQLPADVKVDGALVTLMSISIMGGQSIFIESDGRFAPDGKPLAKVELQMDSVSIGNSAVIDWRHSLYPVEHSFNVIAAVTPTSGVHRIRLIASSSSGYYYIGSGTNLSVVAKPATTVTQSTLSTNAGPYSFNLKDIQPGMPVPFSAVLENDINVPSIASGQPLVVLASGRSYAGSAYGDALWGLWLDGTGERNKYSSWSDNDLNIKSELQAPMFVHGYVPNQSGGTHSVVLGATALPYPPSSSSDSVNYHIGETTSLVTLYGGMTVKGSAPLNDDKNNLIPYICVGTNQGWPACPSVGTDVVIDQATFSVPKTHNGIVFFTAKSRVQGGVSDIGGNVFFWLTLDGRRVGSTGVQSLRTHDGVSTRTICASYLATGAAALAAGTHTVQLHAMAQGSFIHLALTMDLPLMWFD